MPGTLTPAIALRKLIHAGVGCAFAALALAPRWISVPVACAIGLYKCGVEWRRIRKRGSATNLFGWGAALFRAHEQHALSGAAYLALGAAVVIVAFPPNYAALGLMVLALADALAEVVGRTWPVGAFRSKTLSGSGAFFAASLAIVGSFGFPLGWQAVLTASVATLAEALCGVWGRVRIDDNLVIPLVAAATAQALFG